MALDDGVFGGGADQSATAETAQRLMQQYQPADGQQFSSDPVELTQRLLRKLNTEESTTRLKGVDFDKALEKPKKPEAEKAPDLSSLGEPAPDTPKPSSEDLSSLGDAVDPTPAPKPGVLATLGREGTALGKGLARGAPEAVGSMMQGGAALTKQKPESPESLALINELQNSGTMTARERATLMGRTLRTVGDRGLQIDFNAALQRIARGSDANKEATDIRAKYGLINTAAATPVEETPLYKAGTATKEWIDKTVPMTDEEKASVGGQVGTGVASMAPYLAAGIIAGPEAGLILGAAGMGAQTAGDTFTSAKKAGASDEKAITAAGWGGAIGAVLGAAPLGAVFKPVSAASDTWKSWLAAKLVQAGQSGVTFATVGEAQQYLLQQVAKEQYDPQAGYSPDAKRVIASLLTGGVLGTMHPLSPKPADLSSPEAIADFIKKAAAANGRPPPRTPEEERGAATRADIDEALRQRAAKEPEGGEPPDEAPPGTPPEAPSPPAGGEPVPPTEQTVIDGLKRYGWSDDEIAAMSPAMRRREFQDAMAEGGAAAKPAAPAAPSDADQVMQNLTDLFGGKSPQGNGQAAATTFTTAKGSTYEVHEDGTTTRNKAARPDVGHEGDEGPKERSAKTVYVAPDKIGAFAIPQDARWRVIDHNDGTMSLSTWNEKQKKWGISPESKNIPVSTEPSVGAHPLELWKPEKINGLPAYKGMHPGNKIATIGPVNATPGTRGAPIRPESGADVFNAQAAEPTPAQASAENYKHSHMELEHLGLVGKNSISIETGAGQTRLSTDADGTVHENVLPHPYGRIKGTKGADGEPLDITIGPNPKSPHVFVIDQHHNDGSGFDEHKIMAGFDTPQDALIAYGAAYDDLGGNRIGHVTAMSPDDFKNWIKGDTTQPLKKHLSAEEIGGMFDELAGEKGGEPNLPAQEQAGSPEVPHTSPDGGSESTGTGTENVEPLHGEIINPQHVSVEPTEQHHAQIEAALGDDYDRVLLVDVARAAEILAERLGITPQLAFQYAVIENAAAQKFLTGPQLEQAYGPQVQALLVAGGEGAPVGGEHAEQGGSATDQEPASGGKEGGELSGRGENGAPDRAEDTAAENGEQHDTGSPKPDTSGETSGVADDKAGTGEQGSQDSDKSGDPEVVTPEKPAILYHVAPKNADISKGLKSLRSQHGAEADDIFDARGPATQQMRDEHPHLVFFYDTLRDAKNHKWGGTETQIVKVDSAKVPKLFFHEFTSAEGDKHGYWVTTKDVPASALTLPSEPVVEKPETQKIEDAGEKIGGARKDKWAKAGITLGDYADMSEEDKTRSVTKENVWPRPDYKAAVEDGVDPTAAALIKLVYDRIGTKPDSGYSSAVDTKAWYIEALNAARKLFSEAKTVADVKAVNDKIDLVIGEKGHAKVSTLGGRSPLYVTGMMVRRAEKMVAEGFPSAEPWTRLFEAREGRTSPTMEDVKAFREFLDVARKLFEAEKISLDQRGEHNLSLREWKGTRIIDPATLTGDIAKTWATLKELNDRSTSQPIFSVVRKNGGRIGEPYATKEEAEAAAKKAYEGLSEERKKGGEEPTRPHLDNIERSGPDYRKGRNVTGEDFIKDFGFRGVEFGNWVAGDERQKVVNLAYDALHDLARVLGITPKAVSLNGTLAVAFGSRGHGGKASAHYEGDTRAINMTKLKGAGTLAHEWGHAFDDYLGVVHGQAGGVGVSGWRNVPKTPLTHYNANRYRWENKFLPAKLQVAANRLMHDLYASNEEDMAAITRVEDKIKQQKIGRDGWIKRIDTIREAMRKGHSGKGLKEAEEQAGIWSRGVERYEKQLAEGIERVTVDSSYYRQAQALSGSTGDYWKRPNEMFARAFEAYAFDKIATQGFTSQYLVQGAEPDRYGTGFRGNPYPAGVERARINSDFDRLLRALEATEGKHGVASRLVGAKGEPEPVEETTRVMRPAAQPHPSEEAAAVDEASKTPENLGAAFAARLTGDGFKNILDARRLAKEHGVEDVKQVEETLEFAAVKAARDIVETSETPFPELVAMYENQPRLGTRTSTSVRDQAYSTPLPLAYVASRLAKITKDTTVYEPTAGNGALLIAADPAKVTANEINPERRKNLREQGFLPMGYDASTDTPTNQIDIKGVDRVIANPPFGPVKENGESKVFDMSDIQPRYKTTEIDHAIALRSLEAMKDNGRAVLILGGLNKQVTTAAGRSDGYNGKSKREFFKTLYDNYNVTDHFTVAGELYERQGAGWPVDVIVIKGRSKSARSLPAVDVPRIYNSWDALGGLIHGEEGREDVAANGRPNGGHAGERPGLEGAGRRGRGGAGGGGHLGVPGQEQPEGVRNEPVRPEAGGAGGSGAEEPGGHIRGGEPVRSGEQPAAERPSSRLSADEIGDIFDELAAEKPAADTRPTSEVAKSAGKNALKAADEALSGLTELFGGGKTVGMGVNFDEDTYAKAKPMFVAAAERFADSKHDIRELMRRLYEHLRDVLKWTAKALADAKPYFVRFIQDVQDGTVNLLKSAPAEPAAERRANTAVETEGQVSYTPQSKVPALDTLVPPNLREPIADSLRALDKKVGPIDKFVADELGIKEKDLAPLLAGEQVDAVALAIDNLNKGRGFIIGDQTGIGKGRVNAAIIKWAIKKGRIPIFVTERPGLYKDIMRDLVDIGMKPPRMLATNAGLNLPLDEEGALRLKTGDVKSHNSHLGEMRDAEAFKKKYDMVVTTYSQMQTLKGEDTERRRFLSDIIGNATILFDESHNAGGQKAGRGKPGVPGRASFSRDLVQRANGVFYSSATYAKRPDVMDLYAATDMAMAVDDVDSLGEAIERGRVPLQQAVASMLAKAGQYIRRERSFHGINYNTPTVPVDGETYDSISHSLAAIHEFSKIVKRITIGISDDLKPVGGTTVHDPSTGEAGASSTNFTSVMHNVISQMLLSMKAPHAARLAIEAIRRGEKPVLTAANTMESFLKDYADTLDIGVGGDMEGDFADVLMRYLNRARRITITEPFSDPEHHVLTDEELGPAGVAAFNEAKSMIASLDLAHMPISPIDHIRSEIEKAGYRTGEVTGRGLVVDYSGNTPVLRSRPGSETTPAGKNRTIAAFNKKPENGGIHAIVINQSAASGISLHAGEKFDDQSKRRMIIAQPEANIDTHMQILGRINRTGQVVLPEYDQLQADIPAEKRPTAILAKKMASLNANTTASRGSAVTAKDVPDVMNEYGDQIALSYIHDNPEMNERLGEAIKPSSSGGLERDDAMRKLTGRLPLLPRQMQDEIWDHLETEYDSLIKQLEASGTSPLEAKTLNLRARTLETSEVQGKRNSSGSPFAAPVNVEKVSMLRQGKPLKPLELVNALGKLLNHPGHEGADETPAMLAKVFEDATSPYGLWGKKAAEIERIERLAAVKQFEEFIRPLVTKIDDLAAQEAKRTELNAVKDRWTSLHTQLPIGARVRLNMFDGTHVGVVLDVKQTAQPKNPLALGSWKATFAVPDAARQLTIPFSRLFQQGGADAESSLDIEVVPTNERAAETLARFEAMQSGAREERYIATGNLLAAYDWLNMKGSIINYTDQQGAVRQGILTARDFKLGAHAIKKGRIVADFDEIKTLLDQNQTLWSKDRQVNISRADRWSDNYQIQAEKKKATGGRYWMDKDLTALTGDFYSRGGMMAATVSGKSLRAAVERLQAIGAHFTIAAAAPKAEKVDSGEPPPDDEPPAGGKIASAQLQQLGGTTLTPEARQHLDQIKGRLEAIVRRVAGPLAKVNFHDGLIETPTPRGYAPGMSTGKSYGQYTLGHGLIDLALLPGAADQMASTAYHEAYHLVEDKLLDGHELALVKSETPRIRGWLKDRPGWNAKKVDGLSDFEVRSHAFQEYAADRDTGKVGGGLHIMLRRAFDRLLDIVRQVKNALSGLGFKTYEDIFNDAYRGRFAGERFPQMGSGLKAMEGDVLSSAMFRRQQHQAVTSSLRDVIGKATLWNKFRERAQDLNESVKRLQDAVQARMEGELPDSKAFYQKKRLFPGKVAQEVQDFNKQHLDPLVDMLKQKGVSLDDIGDIVYAQHAPERNAYIEGINPDLGAAGSGMTNAEAEAILNRHSPRDLAEISTRVDGIRDFIIDMMVRTGLESRPMVDAWREQYQHYAPLGGFEEPPDDMDDGFRESAKFNVRGREVKQAFGRRSKADNPLINLLDQAYRTIERGKKNEYLKTLYVALADMEGDDRKGFVMFDRGKPRREIDPRTGLVRSVDDSSYRFSPNAVAYKVGGRTHYMVFDQRQMAEVLKRMHPDALNGVGQALLTFQNKLKATWTHANPEFLIRHFMFRYPIEGTLNSFEQNNVPRYMADAIPFLGRASKAIFAANRGETHPNPEVAQYQRYWQEMREAGGAIGFRQMRDIDMTRDHLNRRLRSLTGRPLATVRDKAGAVMEGVDIVTNALDNSLRLAAYAEARRQGKTTEQAAIIGRDATVDYQLSGTWKNKLGLIWPFGNVATQTGARMGSAVSRSKTMAGVFGASIAAGFMTGMYNYLVGGDDTDHIPYVDKLPWWMKQLHMPIVTPFHHDDGKPIFLHIPMPYNWAAPFTMGQAMATMAFSPTRGETRKAIAASIKAAISAFSPFAEDANPVSSIAPELLKVPIRSYMNQDWTGGRVHNDPAWQKGPRAESGERFTGEGWKYSAHMLNALSGGDKHHSGYLDFFPEDLRNVLTYYTGTETALKLGEHAKHTYDNAVAGKPTDYSNVPLSRVFVGENYEAADRARRSENRRESKRPWER